MAAALAPDLLPTIPLPLQYPQHHLPDTLGRTMLQHQHGDAAFDYAMGYPEPSTFPFQMVPALIE